MGLFSRLNAPSNGSSELLSLDKPILRGGVFGILAESFLGAVDKVGEVTGSLLGGISEIAGGISERASGFSLSSGADAPTMQETVKLGGNAAKALMPQREQLEIIAPTFGVKMREVGVNSLGQ